MARWQVVTGALAGLALGIGSALASGAARAEASAPTEIALERDARFPSPAGDLVAVAAGAWRVEAVGDAALRLLPEQGAAVTVAARAIAHAEELSGPLALAAPGGDGGLHVLLLFPDGAGYEAAAVTGELATRGGEPLPADAIQRGVASRGVAPARSRAEALGRAGRSCFEQSTEWGHLRAIRYYEAALAADPGYAPAAAGLADAYALLYLHVRPKPEYLAEAKRYAARALELAPKSSEAHAAQGYLLGIERDPKGAARELELALEYDPRNAMARQAYAGVLMTLEQVEASLAQISRAVADAPSSALLQGIASRLHQVARRYDAAIRYGVRAEQLNPDLPSFIRMSLAYSYWATKRPSDALEAFLLDPGIPPDQKPALRALGQQQDLRAVVERVLASRTSAGGRPCGDVPSITGTVLAFLEESGPALDCLELSMVEGTPPAFLALDPILDPVRKEPRFARLLARQPGR